MTGWTEDQILDQRAVWLDWLLAIQDTVDNVRRKNESPNTMPREVAW